jgi:amidase
MIDDPLGAFCRDNHVEVGGAPTGPLAGVTLAVKDVFDIAGSITGAGSPDWLRTHPPAERTAPVVQRLLDAGARVIGKTQTDELVYSLNGENAHYGTPVNPRAPGRIPGGSSSGSASAVAGGLADVALGTDCAGSVRLPASFCGIFGFRPTHGRVSADGAVALAPSFDAVGWFARDAELLERVGRVLMPEPPPPSPRRVLVVTDAFALVGDRMTDALRPGVDGVTGAVERAGPVLAHPSGLGELKDWFRVLQAFEVWATHGEWVRRVKPDFGPGIKERYEWAATVTADQIEGPRQAREQFAARLDAMLADGAVLCLPTAPGIAPLLKTPADALETFRAQAIGLLSIAGLARLPQVSLPLGTLDGCPVGLSLVGRRGSDLALLALARSLGP